MGYECAAHSCSNSTDKKKAGRVIHFHKFPEDTNLLKKWIIATKFVGFAPDPSKEKICGDHFTQEDYLFSFSSRLKPDAVPSKFNFPPHLQKRVPNGRADPSERKLRQTERDLSNKQQQTENSEPPQKKIKASPSKEELKNTIINLRKKVKTLQQKTRRQNTKIETQSELIADLKQRNLLDDDVAAMLDENFSGITADLLKSELKNQHRDPRGRRYTDEVKKFALTLDFYSPRAYEYLRKVFSLPHRNSLKEWTSSVNCEPGFFQDVFDHLKSKVDENPKHSDCVLICDAMSIHELLKYNQSMGKWDGYVNFGEGIAVPDPDVLAKDALVFLLVSFKGGWKYPVGYVLCDKISAKDLNTLLKKSLDFCIEANLKVRCVTMDGTSTNFSAMKLFGCKTGTSLREIFPFFVHEGYDHLV